MSVRVTGETSFVAEGPKFLYSELRGSLPEKEGAGSGRKKTGRCHLCSSRRRIGKQNWIGSWVFLFRLHS